MSNKNVVKQLESPSTNDQILLEQYKLYVQMADNISTRRGQTNTFYITVLSTIITIFAFFKKKDVSDPMLLIVSLLGLLLCFIWRKNIQSYRQLNSGKFKVITNMENYLPYKCYTEEWNILDNGENKKKYKKLTAIEQQVPILLGIPYGILFIYSISKILKNVIVWLISMCI
mgnify:CR=1 FL=1|jgi:hypothetical protein